MFQLSPPYMTTGKTISLTIWTFVSKVVSLLLNTLSRFVIDFLPRSNWKKSFNFMTTVTVHSDFGAQDNKISERKVKIELMGSRTTVKSFSSS